MEGGRELRQRSKRQRFFLLCTKFRDFSQRSPMGSYLRWGDRMKGSDRKQEKRGEITCSYQVGAASCLQHTKRGSEIRDPEAQRRRYTDQTEM